MQSNKTIIITVAFLILNILAAGCISTDPVQTKTAAQGNQIDAKETPPKVDAPVEEAEPAPVETHWWDSKAGYEDAQVGTYSTLFDTDVEAVKSMISDRQSYNLFDIETEARILRHQEIGAADLNLERELQPAQYKELVAEYGRPVHVTMETIDDDSTRAGMDHVAVKYVGDKGVLEFERPYDEDMGLSNHIGWHLYENKK